MTTIFLRPRLTCFPKLSSYLKTLRDVTGKPGIGPVSTPPEPAPFTDAGRSPILLWENMLYLYHFDTFSKPFLG